MAPNLVVLVHGTWAHDPEHEDEGPRWWQRDSDTWRELAELLSDGVELPPEGRLFHWSGRNTQSHRYAAANRLLATLLRLEMEGRSYHLVGHSHGGSLIWEALVSARVVQDRGVVPYELTRHLVDPELPGAVPARERLRPADVAAAAKLPGLRSWTTVGTPRRACAIAQAATPSRWRGVRSPRRPGRPRGKSGGRAGRSARSGRT